MDLYDRVWQRRANMEFKFPIKISAVSAVAVRRSSQVLFVWVVESVVQLADDFQQLWIHFRQQCSWYRLSFRLEPCRGICPERPQLLRQFQRSCDLRFLELLSRYQFRIENCTDHSHRDKSALRVLESVIGLPSKPQRLTMRIAEEIMKTKVQIKIPYSLAYKNFWIPISV